VRLERDQAYANFVIGTGLSFTFEQYLTLSRRQRSLIIGEANRARR